MLELALRYQLLSSQTSFVAIEERVEGAQTERAQLRRVPVALTHGWGGVERALQSTTRVSMARASLAPAMDLDIPALRHRAAGPATDIASSAGCYDLVDAFAPGLDAAPAIEGAFVSRSMNVLSSRGRKPGTPVDGFMRLTLSQRADGSFRLDDATLREFGLEASALARAAEQLGGGEAAAAVVHTAVALVLLERRFARARGRVAHAGRQGAEVAGQAGGGVAAGGEFVDRVGGYAASTIRTSMVTLSWLRTASNMAARLSMLGLPFGDSMRWRLLLGL